MDSCQTASNSHVASTVIGTCDVNTNTAGKCWEGEEKERKIVNFLFNLDIIIIIIIIIMMMIFIIVVIIVIIIIIIIIFWLYSYYCM